MAAFRVAVDVGGTFTDVCVLDEAGGEVRVGKVPSTADPIDAVVAGVVGADVDLRDVVLFSHGTTVATNALITRNLPAAAMVTTRGFRDVLEIRRGTKPDLWDAYNDVAPPYIRRRDRLGDLGAPVPDVAVPEARRAVEVALPVLVVEPDAFPARDHELPAADRRHVGERMPEPRVVMRRHDS